MCCAAFALGGAKSNFCPSSYLRLDRGDACASAATFANRTYGGSSAYSYYPAGCYWHTITGGIYYNTHATGAANYFAEPLCAGAAPAYPSRHMHAVDVAVAPLIPRCCYA